LEKKAGVDWATPGLETIGGPKKVNLTTKRAKRQFRVRDCLDTKLREKLEEAWKRRERMLKEEGRMSKLALSVRAYRTFASREEMTIQVVWKRRKNVCRNRFL